MSAPFAERIVEKLSPAMTPDFEDWCIAVGAPFEAVNSITEEHGEEGGVAPWEPPYSRVMNPVTCPGPFLPWLGQFVGVEVPKVSTEAEARELVKGEKGLARGTRGALENELRRVLGSHTFTIQERTAALGTEEAFHFNILVGNGLVTTALYEAVNNVKSAGLWYSLFEATNTWLNGVKKHWTEVTVSHASEMTEGNY